MRFGLSAVAAAMIAAGLMTGAASAQGLNAGMAGDTGGVGITPNGGGFDGTLGDPAYAGVPAVSRPAASPLLRAPSGAW